MDTTTAYTLSALDYVWIAGTILSSLCLMLQGVLSAIKPKLRHVEQSILLQLTVARLALTFLEVFSTTSSTYEHYKMYMKDALGAVYLYLVSVLVCLTVVYAKNLRDQVLSKSALQKWNYSIVFTFVWFLSILAALKYFFMFCLEIPHASLILKVYVGCLVFIMTCNVLLFCEIMYQLLSRTSHYNYAKIFKRIAISLILACLANVSIIMKYFTDNENVMYFLSVFNSFQVIAMTFIFVIPVGSSNAQFGLTLD